MKFYTKAAALSIPFLMILTCTGMVQGKLMEEKTVTMRDDYRVTVEVDEERSIKYHYDVRNTDEYTSLLTLEIYYQPEGITNQMEWEYIGTWSGPYGNDHFSLKDKKGDFIFIWQDSNYSIGDPGAELWYKISIEEHSDVPPLCNVMIFFPIVVILIATILLGRAVKKI